MEQHKSLLWNCHKNEISINDYLRFRCLCIAYILNGLCLECAITVL